jgi:branched-subunit amino acid ABC-type transport system permease component
VIYGQAVVDGILTGGVYALMAAGLTLTFGVMQVINVAQGVLVVLGAYLSYELAQHGGIDPFVGLLITVPALFVLGVVIEVVLIRRLRHLSVFNFVVMAILATYAVSVITEGALDLAFGSGLVEVQASYVDNSFVWFGMHLPEIYVYGFLLAAGCSGRSACCCTGPGSGAACGRPSRTGRRRCSSGSPCSGYRRSCSASGWPSRRPAGWCSALPTPSTAAAART